MKPSPVVLGHEAIAASAGSGKTFQLAHRFIRLLAAGVAPERIAALTFSRKAAGEILDAIVRYLCAASADAKGAAATGERIGMPSMRCGEFVRLLRRLLDAMPRLHIGTLDRFMVGILRAFPMELGLPAEFRIGDEEDVRSRRARRAVFAGLLRSSAHDAARRAFHEAFKQATFGRQVKSFFPGLEELLDGYRALYRALPDASRWGREGAIWPREPWWAPPWNAAREAAAARAAVMREAWPARFRDGLLRIIDFAGAYDEHARWDAGIENAVFARLLEQRERLAAGGATIAYGRGAHDIPAELGRPLARLLGWLVRVECRRALQCTRGLARLLEQYESFYEDRLRVTGDLAFADAPYLLSGAGGRGPVPGRTPGDPARLYIDFRLDARLDHWLLDEFQDTSDLQWSALSNLADEILQDTSGQRSFFMVGDIKQAIYGWRGGNARLFVRLCDRYREVLEVRGLDESFRSSPPVIRTVNRVFGSMAGDRMAAGVAERWARTWQEHRWREGVVPTTGYAALLEAPPGEGQKACAEDRYGAVAGLLGEIDPPARGLTAAVLVRTNAQAAEVAGYLRAACPSVKIVLEGAAALLDNPVVSLLLSLVHFAAHPGDLLAWRHLQMSPLRRHLEERRWDRAALCGRLLSDLQQLGFTEFLRRWGDRLEEAGAMDTFGRARLGGLLEAAERFEAEEGGGVNEFRAFIESRRDRDEAGSGAVRVMTVHQAKGLEFDAVFLPELRSATLDHAGHVDLLTGRDRGSERIRWILCKPQGFAVEADETLAGALADADHDECFEELCILYVALTRARRALYLVASPPFGASAVFRPEDLLRLHLAREGEGGEGEAMRIGDCTCRRLFADGDADWFRVIAERTPAAGEKLPKTAPWPRRWRGMVAGRRARLSPSAEADETQRGADLLAEAGREGRVTGSVMHGLFERIEWTETADPRAVLDAWAATSGIDAGLRRDIEARFARALEAAEIAAALRRPPVRVELWREKTFEAVLDGRWISGAFDRVVVERDAEGRATGATVYDFKTNRVNTDEEIRAAVEHYRPQMDLYRRVLAFMLGLDAAAVGRVLLFTHPGRSVRVEDQG